MVNDKFTVGAAKNGTTMDTTFAEDGSVVMLDTATVSMTENDGGYNIFLRYIYVPSEKYMFLSLQHQLANISLLF